MAPKTVTEPSTLPGTDSGRPPKTISRTLMISSDSPEGDQQRALVVAGRW